MAIYSDLKEAYKGIYTLYIQKSYLPLIHQKTQGLKLMPVIKVADVERIFKAKILCNTEDSVGTSAYVTYCDVSEPVLTLHQFEVFAYKHNFLSRKAYVDLKVAFSLYRYNSYLSDSLVLLLSDMYNASQLHIEFEKCIKEKLQEEYQGLGRLDLQNFSVDTNPANSICYKELMDYFHYQGEKPKVSFQISISGIVHKGYIEVSDYDGFFDYVSYNLQIRSLTIL